MPSSRPAHIGTDGWLFTNSRGGLLRYENWRRRVWNVITTRAGLEGVTVHDLRRTALTRLMLQDGWSPAEVQRYAGHTDPRTTLALYVLVNPAELP